MLHDPGSLAWRNARTHASALSPTSDPLKLLAGSLIVADLSIVLLTSLGAYLLRHGPAIVPRDVAATTVLAALLTVNACHLAGAYGRMATASPVAQIGVAARSWSVVFATMLVLAYLTKSSDEFSRAWAVGWYSTALLLFALSRVFATRQVARWRRLGRLARTVAIVDLCGAGDRLARRLQRQAKDAIRLVGVFGPDRLGDKTDTTGNLLALARLFRIDEVLVAVSGQQDSETDAVVRKLGTLPANVRLCPDLPAMSVVPREALLMFGEPMLTVYHRPMTGWSRIVKRAEDLVLASLALVFIAPFLLVVALLIKLDSPGPVLFRQRRLGFNNNVITVYKFRSMRHEAQSDSSVPQAQRNDKRLTRLGGFLRKTSIDELPQLFNVLRGEMSLVGPRPHALAHNEEYAALIDDYLGRHRVQPGITGWAQVNGLRGETETLDKMRRRVEHDLAYIDGWSLTLDLRIMFLTVLKGAFDRNAY